MEPVEATITLEEVQQWCIGSFGLDHTATRLKDILTGEYPLEEAREDILSFRVEDTADESEES